MNRLEALNHILEASKAGLLGALDEHEDGCVYWQPATNKNCAIGCLLPLPILQRLIDDEKNEDVSVIGLPDYALGLLPFTEKEGNGLQDLHDSCYRNELPETFQEAIQHLIDNYDDAEELDL